MSKAKKYCKLGTERSDTRGVERRDIVKEEPSALESKLEDTIELLHLWKNEAYAYRNLIEAVASGRFSLSKARELLESNQTGFRLLGCSCFALGAMQDPADRGADCRLEVLLSREECDAFISAANKARLSPAEFLWSCVDSMMNSADDEDVLRGCREAAERRFKN